MSKHFKTGRKTVVDITNSKGKNKIVCLTAYTAPMAALLDEYCDLLLVGDSLGMVVHGLSSTVGVTLDMMILHGQAVLRGSEKALVVVDLPFGTYEQSPETAYQAASKVMREVKCQAVKVEAGKDIPHTIAFLVDRGIPVVGHIGIRPQAINVEGRFRAKGKSAASRRQIIAEAKAVEAAGAFAMVIEGVAQDLADEITHLVSIPTIGIGASASCDGQILVTDDMLGLFDWTPNFVRQYAKLRVNISEAVQGYSRDIREGKFPSSKELYFTSTDEA